MLWPATCTTMRKKQKNSRLPEGDDGRTITNMNVEGMPWYTPGAPGAPSEGEPMTHKEMWTFIRSAVGAALLVVGVLSVGLLLFVLFCTNVWLK